MRVFLRSPSVPAKAGAVLFVTTFIQLWGPHSLITKVCRWLFPRGESSRSLKFTIHITVVLWCGMHVLFTLKAHVLCKACCLGTGVIYLYRCWFTGTWNISIKLLDASFETQNEKQRVGGGAGRLTDRDMTNGLAYHVLMVSLWGLIFAINVVVTAENAYVLHIGLPGCVNSCCNGFIDFNCRVSVLQTLYLVAYKKLKVLSRNKKHFGFMVNRLRFWMMC